MRTLAVINEKGGVGKTTIATHIAAGLAMKHNLKVLLVDADPQGHSTLLMGIKRQPGFYHLLGYEERNETDWNEVAVEAHVKHWAGTEATIGQLFVLPSDESTRLIPDIPRVKDNPLILRRRLEEVSQFFDVVIMDTLPSPSPLFSLLSVAMDAALYVTKCEYLAVDGIGQSTVHMSQQGAMRKHWKLDPVKLIGVVPTMYQPTNAHAYGIDRLEQFFKAKMWRAISHATVWRDREWAEQTMFAYAPEHAGTAEIMAVVDRVARELELVEVDGERA